MKKSKQAGKYILSDFISASVAWLLFNILRYEVFAIDEGADSLLDYLQYPGVLGGQVVIPLFWLVLYYFSGYYNKPFGKSRLTELFSTFITVLIGTVFVFFALLLDDIPRSIDIYYKLFFGMFGLQFLYIMSFLFTLKVKPTSSLILFNSSKNSCTTLSPSKSALSLLIDVVVTLEVSEVSLVESI